MNIVTSDTIKNTLIDVNVLDNAVNEFKNTVMHKRKIIADGDLSAIGDKIIVRFNIKLMNAYIFSTVFNILLDDSILYSSITFPKISSYSNGVSCFITDDGDTGEVGFPICGYWGIGDPSDYEFRHSIHENLFREQMYLDDFIFNK